MPMLASGMDLVSISGGSGYRPEAGRILPYGGTTAPEGYLLCDGAAYSRTEYSELFDVIGTTFGSGDGSTTFNVPDLRSRTLVGAYEGRPEGVNENLLYTDRCYHSTNSYECYKLYMTQNMTKGQTYTLQLWDVDVSHAGKDVNGLGLSAYWGGSYVSLIDANGPSYFTNGHADHLVLTFTAPNNSNAETNNAWLVLWNSVPNVNAAMSMRVGAWKLEAGSTATEWCPRFGAEHSLDIGSMGGEAIHTLTTNEMPVHFHRDMMWGENSGNYFGVNNSGAGKWRFTYSSAASEPNFYTDRRGGDQPHENMPPYQVVNYIICTGKLGYAGIKGDKGDTGDTGAAAGFGTPTATVDSNVGTPSVTVTATGPDTAKVFEFEFENMKGEKGDRGEPITVDNFVPVAAGLIYPYAGSTAPTGYLMCDGAAVSRITYADLFEAIGTTYGAGDGETTFNVPDLRGRVPLGSSNDYALGSTGGEASHTLQESEMPSHSHTMNHGHGFTQPTVNGGGGTNNITGGSHAHPIGLKTNCGDGSARWGISDGSDTRNSIVKSSTHTHSLPGHTHSVSGGKVSDHSGSTGSKGGGEAHNNLQPYTATNYIISTGFEYGGLQGEAAGFGTPTASVDANVGTPSVTVTATGPDTAKVFDFAFSNLKGERGEQGAQGPQGVQGPKGDTGDMATGFYVGTTEPQDSSYFFWYNPLNGAVRVKQYVEPDSLTDGGWAWREMVFADEGKNGDIYMATADELEEAVIAG